MDSSHEGAVNKLNGHGTAAASNSRPFEPQKTQLSGLVDELAQAMNMARDSLERPSPASMSAAAAPLPAMPAPRSLFDDEEDDAAMPIPSTWREQPELPKKGSLRDQVRAASLGFATGLAVIVPVVLLLSGRLDDLSLDSLFGQTDVAGSQMAQSAAVPVQVQQRVVSTTLVTPAQAPPQATPAVAEAAVAEEPAVEPEASWTSAVSEGKKRILAGDIVGGREVLKPAVAANEPEAIMALAETYDPNMLAAWGVRDIDSDVQLARELYEKALGVGVESARGRLGGLN